MFVGPLGGGKVPNNGASIKNYYIRNALSACASKAIFIDTENWKSNPFVLLKLLVIVLFLRHSKFVISANNLSAYRLLKLLNILQTEGDIYYWVIGGSIANWIKEHRVSAKTYRIVKLFIVEGKSMEETLNTCGFSNVLTIPNFKTIKYIPHKNGDNEIFKFVFLSRITKPKGCDIILEASRKLNELGKEDRFSIDFYGPIDSNYKEEFLRRIDTIKNVHYKGFIDLRDTKNYDILASYDVMLFPTYWHGEGFPGIIIDAYIAGLPVIATDWSLNKDILENGVTGLLVPPHDAEALGKAMLKAINRTIDVKQMSLNCQSRALNYDAQYVLRKEILEKIGLIENA